MLTKPDTLVEAELSEWMPVITGARDKLHHGYYVTKQPGANELNKNLTFDKARAFETEYFAKAPWKDLDHDVRSRVGTQALTRALSVLLSDLIMKWFV